MHKVILTVNRQTTLPSVFPTLLAPAAVCGLLALSLPARAMPSLSASAAACPAHHSRQAHGSQSGQRAHSGQPIAHGVWGWTSGSQTYLRARPGAETPAIAKVPCHTRVFVWGRFNGWYRVETPDHNFGWVFNEYINAPRADRIATLSHQRAREASDRTANQTMYGSPALLRRHYAQYGAPGAVRGLAEQGVHIASRPATSAPRLAAAQPPHVARTQASRPAATHSAAHPATSLVTYQAPHAAASVTTRTSSQAHAVQNPAARSVRVAERPPTSTHAATPHAVPEARTAIHHEAAPVHRIAAAPHIAASTRTVAPPAVTVAPAPRLAERTVRAAARPVSSAMRPTTARRAAPRLALNTPVNTAGSRPPQAHESAPVESSNPTRLALTPSFSIPAEPSTPADLGSAPAVTTANSSPSTLAPSAPSPVPSVSAVQPRAAVQSHPATRPAIPPQAALAPTRRLTRAQQRQQWRLYQARLHTTHRTQQRAALRRRMGGPIMAVPPRSLPGLAPIAPEELMRAQQQWSAAQRSASVPAPPDTSLPAPEGMLTPSSFIPAFPRGSMTGGITGCPAGSSDVQPLGGSGMVLTTAQLPPTSGTTAVATPGNGASQSHPATTGSAAPSRGGSPRDYARYWNQHDGQNNGDFGRGLASQALTYRGMPYHRGAASPSRGFDCSGLVYFLLRARGYNPPRMAAGYAHYGTAVERSQLQPGDLLLFANTYRRGISHIGVYMGNGQFVHAARAGEGVRVDSLDSAYYRSKYWGARRVR